ncbi:MAG: NUDIX hydrolase [Nanoarchaeota archaeon]
MESRIVVSLVLEKDGQLLLGRKKNGVGPYPNSWLILGGGMDLGKETTSEALRRETQEEAGIEIGDIEQIGFDEDNEPDKDGVMTHYLFLIFKAKWISGDPRPGDDIVELRWFTKSDFPSIPLPRPSLRLFKKLGYL